MATSRDLGDSGVNHSLIERKQIQFVYTTPRTMTNFRSNQKNLLRALRALVQGHTKPISGHKTVEIGRLIVEEMVLIVSI